MVYLDYSATTKPEKEVLDTFIKASAYLGNPNSLHALGTKAKNLIDASTKQIENILNLKNQEIIYTSGASEANNTVIKAMLGYKNRGTKIITTKLEHSSIYAPLNYLEEHGFKIEYAPLINGRIDIKALEKMIDDNTILVSVSAVNSETGIKQDIEAIGQMLKKYPKTFFHSDVTQAIGKIKINFENIDFASLSAHKFYGIKGIGALIKKKNINITPLIMGGKSTTIYRSGTPATELIASLAKALRLAYIDIDSSNIKKLNEKIKNTLKKYENVYINSNEYSIPHILNISIPVIKAETMLHALEEDNIYISAKTACSKEEASLAILALTGDTQRAKSSLRISISKKTTEEEIDQFLIAFDKCYRSLYEKNN